MSSMIGAQLFTLRDYLQTTEDIRATLRRVSELGYTAAQLSGHGAGTPQEISDFADEAGVAIVATHVSYDRVRDDVESVIAEHRLWNCRHVGIGGMPAEYRNADGFARFAADATRTARPLIDAGLTFSYHNHSFELERFGGRTGLEILAAESDPEVFCFEVDTYWIQHGGGNPVSWLRRLRGRMHLVHLKDMAMSGSRQLFAEVGEGNLEWGSILAACRETGIEYFLVEQDQCLRDPFESLGTSLKNLQAMGLS